MTEGSLSKRRALVVVQARARLKNTEGSTIQYNQKKIQDKHQGVSRGEASRSETYPTRNVFSLLAIAKASIIVVVK